MTAILVGILTGFALEVYFLNQPQKSHSIWSPPSGPVTAYSHIHLEISPIEYPAQGQSWTLSVYSTNITADKVLFTPLSNATIQVNVKENGIEKSYQLSPDASGHAQFQYLGSYSDVAFQAYSGDVRSESIVVGSHYVTSTVVERMIEVSSFFSLMTFLFAGLAKLTHKVTRLLGFLLILFLAVLFSIIAIFAFYASFYLETAWGFPENIIGSFVTFSVLEYATIVGIILFFSFVVVMIVTKFRANHKNNLLLDE